MNAVPTVNDLINRAIELASRNLQEYPEWDEPWRAMLDPYHEGWGDGFREEAYAVTDPISDDDLLVLGWADPELFKLDSPETDKVPVVDHLRWVVNYQIVEACFYWFQDRHIEVPVIIKGASFT